MNLVSAPGGQRLAATGREPAVAVEIALILAVALVIRAPFLDFSVIDRDESAFLIAAREMLRGHLPYTTFFDIKPLGSTTLVASAVMLFGERVAAARLLASACAAATALLLRSIALELGGGRVAGFLAAMLYVAFSVRLNGLAAHTEVLLAPFTAAGMLLLLREGRRAAAAPPRASRLLAAGLLLGTAVWIKYVPAVPAALVVGVVLLGALLRRRTGPARTVGLGMVFAAALAAPTLATMAVYWGSGMLDLFLYSNFGFAGRYVGAGPTSAEVVRRVTLVLLEFWPLLLLGAVHVGLALRRRGAAPDPWSFAALAAWLAGEAMAVTAPRQFFGHYFLMLLPPLSTMAGLALAAAGRRLAAPGEAGRAALLAGGFVAVVPCLPHALDAARVMTTRVDLPRELAARIRPELRPGETLYVANWEPILHLLTGTPLPTPYAFPEHLVGPWRVITRFPTDGEVERVLAARPRFIVLDEVGMKDVEPRARAAVEMATAAHYRLHAQMDSRDGSVRARAYILVD